MNHKWINLGHFLENGILKTRYMCQDCLKEFNHEKRDDIEKAFEKSDCVKQESMIEKFAKVIRGEYRHEGIAKSKC